MKMNPSAVSWDELARSFNICNFLCENRFDCDKAVTLQTNYPNELVSVCGERPIKGQEQQKALPAGGFGRKLRLLLFDECHRACDGCCNKDFDLANLPVCSSYADYEHIILTGGEPMLHPEVVSGAVRQIRWETTAPISLYTALTADKEALSQIVRLIDGITVTLHDNSDVKPFLEFDSYHCNPWKIAKSYRLNIFRGVEIDLGNVKGRWKIKSDIVWIKNCPLPEGEVLMRYSGKDHSLRKMQFGNA